MALFIFGRTRFSTQSQFNVRRGLGCFSPDVLAVDFRLQVTFDRAEQAIVWYCAPGRDET
jgi:hypothetical protein